MRTSDVDILIVPGWSSSGPDHWQSRWERHFTTARRVEQDDWEMPDRARWVARLVEEVSESERPAVLVAHSLGVATVVHAAEALQGGKAAGAFLVAPSDPESLPQANGFSPMPLRRLPFPALVLASSNDPHCAVPTARQFASAWGAGFIEAGELGHINTLSGHGPWPEGLLRFGVFLKDLG